jgi:hypothetical protein
MLIVQPGVEAMVAEVRSRLDAGKLAGLGPVALTSGAFSDAELAGRILLAEADHLSTLADHTGRPAGPDRWAQLGDDLYLILRQTGDPRDGTAGRRDSLLTTAP